MPGLQIRTSPNVYSILKQCKIAELKAYPNPANNWKSFTYKLLEIVNTAIIEVMDVQGHQIQSFNIQDYQGLKLWDIWNFEDHLF